MRRKKICILIVFLITIIFGIYIYQKTNSNLKVQCSVAEKKIIIYQVKDNTKLSIEECWTSLDDSTINTFDVGDSISLSFSKNPDTIEIWEILLNPLTKTSLYQNVSKQQILYTINENKVMYSIPDNIATRLSSNPPETDLRAYVVRLLINDQELLYTFLVKTNSIV